MVMKMRNKEKSVYSVILATYGEFFRNMNSKWLIMVGLSLLPSLISPLKVYLEKFLFDSAEQIYINGSISEDIKWILPSLLCLQIIFICCYAVYRSSINYIGSDLEILLQNNLNAKTARLHMRAFEHQQTYKNIELAASASRELRFMVMMFTSELFVYLVTFVTISGVLTSYHYSLIIMGGLAVIPDICTKVIQANYQYKKMDYMQELTRSKEYFEKILAYSEFQKEVRVYGTSSFFLKKWIDRREKWCQEKRKVISRNLVIRLICEGINCITAFASIFLVIALLLHKAISVGEFASALSAVLLLKTNFMRILSLGLFSFQCGLNGRYYYSVFDYEERTGKEEDISPEGGIELDHVSFAYDDGKKVLEDVCFTIQPGQTIAIVGANGAGKSTFSKMILGLYEPEEGIVWYSGKNVAEYAESFVFRHLSAVFQDYCRYYFTVQENICIGNPENLDMDFMAQLMEKLQIQIRNKTTKKQQLSVKLGVEFGGEELSGGTWQKIAIARGLYKNHKFIPESVKLTVPAH